MKLKCENIVKKCNHVKLLVLLLKIFNIQLSNG